MILVQLQPLIGDFAENKDIARDIRVNMIMPALGKGDAVTLDFTGVSGATQSFIHALISEPIRQHGSGVLEKILFQSCNETIQKIISIVSEYMQESE